MNREDLLEAIGAADGMMLEASEKRTKRNWMMSVTAAAVCLAFLAGIVGIGGRRAVHTVVGEAFLLSDQLSYEIPDHAHVPDTGVGCADTRLLDPTTQFGRAMSVHAKIVEILPDTYCTHGTTMNVNKTAFRILRLKVLDSIVGSKMPSEIFYLLPAYLSMDLWEYDSFIVTVKQTGFENCVMVNVTHKKVETFTMLFQPWARDAGWGSVLAFTDDKLDTSLWEKEGWNKAKEDVMAWISETGPEVYPGKIDRTVKETKQAIQNAREATNGGDREQSTVITMAAFRWKEARQALSSVENRGEGDFWSPTLDVENVRYVYEEIYNVDLSYTRIINGFATNEFISLRTYLGEPWKHVWQMRSAYQSAYHSAEHFTDEDIQNLPDLKGFLQQVEDFAPPSQEGATQFQLTFVYGDYNKRKGFVFGHVTCTWNYELEGETKTKSIYYLVFQDNTYQEVNAFGSIETDNAMDEWIAKQ